MFKTSKRLVAMLICLAMVLSMVPAVFAADAAGTTLYMTPSSNWLENSPWFAAYFFGDSGNTWVKMADSDNDGTYEVVVPEGGYTKVIFCRMDPGKLDTLDWGAKWSQTGDLSIPSDDNVLYVVSGWGSGAWTTIGGTVEQDTNYYLRGLNNNWNTCDDSNRMTKNADGSWTITLTVPAGDHQYKAAWSDWTNAVGDPNASNSDRNAELSLAQETEVTFTLKDGVLTATYSTDCTHTNVNNLPAEDASCTTAGKTAGSVCADCGATIVAQEEIPALGHDIVDGTCTVCGLVIEMITVYYENNWMFQDLTAYWWGSSISNPEWPGVAPEQYSVTEAGYIVYAIEVPSDAAGLLFAGKDNDYGNDRKTPDIKFEAGKVYYMNWTEADGEHVLSYDLPVEPGCEHEYFYPCDAFCMLCGELTNPEAAHNILHVEAVEAPCGGMGNIEYWYCSDCGSCWDNANGTGMPLNMMSVKTFKDHTIVHVEAKAATCYENGNIEHWYCSECGYAWLDADCTLNTNLKAVILPAAHEAAIHVEAKAATCYENGNIEYWYCEACGQAWLDADCTLNTNLKAVILPMAHADAIHVEAKAATCYENGNIEYWYCEACGQAWLDADCTLNTNLKAVILPMAHAEATHVAAKAPTCSENGNIEYWYCADCGQAWLDADCTLNTNLKAVVLPASGHDAECGHVSDIKWQVNKGTNADSASTDLRLITYVDSLDYTGITFKVTVGGNTVEYTCYTVYTSILAGGSRIDNPDKIFGNEDAKYFVTYTLTGVPAAAFDTEIQVDVVWTDLDGNEIEGVGRTIVISDFYA